MIKPGASFIRRFARKPKAPYICVAGSWFTSTGPVTPGSCRFFSGRSNPNPPHQSPATPVARFCPSFFSWLPKTNHRPLQPLLCFLGFGAQPNHGPLEQSLLFRSGSCTSLFEAPHPNPIPTHPTNPPTTPPFSFLPVSGRPNMPQPINPPTPTHPATRSPSRLPLPQMAFWISRISSLQSSSTSCRSQSSQARVRRARAARVRRSAGGVGAHVENPAGLGFRSTVRRVCARTTGFVHLGLLDKRKSCLRMVETITCLLRYLTKDGILH